MTGPRVLLAGMMGAGKSTVGAALSRRTGWPYVDNDALVARAAGRLTVDVLKLDGVARLRRLESAALTEALAAPTPVIAAVAGGVVDDDDDLARLRGGGFVVWLRARLETLTARVSHDAPRPWLGEHPAEQLARLYAGRAERYAAAASLTVDVDELDPEEVAMTVLETLTAEGLGPR